MHIRPGKPPKPRPSHRGGAAGSAGRVARNRLGGQGAGRNADALHQIEEQTIGGLIAACEPRPSGQQPERRDTLELASLREQVRRQAQELNQARSVLRTTRRQLGVATALKPIAVKPGTWKDCKPTKATVRRPTVRSLTMVRRLLKADATAAAASGGTASTAPASGATSTPEPGKG